MSKMSTFDRLGEVCSKIRKTFEYENEDYDLDGSGECGKMIARSWNRQRAKIVGEYGFKNLYHFCAVVERRTSARWVHFNFPVDSTR